MQINVINVINARYCLDFKAWLYDIGQKLSVQLGRTWKLWSGALQASTECKTINYVANKVSIQREASEMCQANSVSDTASNIQLELLGPYFQFYFF